MSRLRLTAMIAAALAALAIPTAGVAGAASAASSKWTPYHHEFSFVEEDACGVPGLTLQNAFDSQGRERYVPHGRDRLPFYSNIGKVVRTVTNTTTGESVTQEINVVLHDLKATNNGDTLTFITLRLARDVYTHDGQVIARGGVAQQIRAMYDHGGTPTNPDDDEWLEETVIKEVGSTPDFCTTITQAIG
jgi:hypothetical protein